MAAVPLTVPPTPPIANAAARAVVADQIGARPAAVMDQVERQRRRTRAMAGLDNIVTNQELGAQIAHEQAIAVRTQPPPIAAAITGPPPEWFAPAFAMAIAPLTARVTTLTTAMTTLTATVTTMAASMTTMAAKIDNDRLRRVNAANAQAQPAGPLLPLVVERPGGPTPVGAVPPVPYRPTLEAMRTLNAAQITLFHTHYLDPGFGPGVPLPQRRAALVNFLSR